MSKACAMLPDSWLSPLFGSWFYPHRKLYKKCSFIKKWYIDILVSYELIKLENKTFYELGRQSRIKSNLSTSKFNSFINELNSNLTCLINESKNIFKFRG